MKAIVVLMLLAGAALADDPPAGFAAYPGSRQLCSQHVTGNTMHIIWSSHATKESLAKVLAHYEKALGKKAKAAANGASTIEVDANRHVTIYPRASEDKLPTCETKSSRGEGTLVMLSTAIR